MRQNIGVIFYRIHKSLNNEISQKEKLFFLFLTNRNFLQGSKRLIVQPQHPWRIYSPVLILCKGNQSMVALRKRLDTGMRQFQLAFFHSWTLRNLDSQESGLSGIIHGLSGTRSKWYISERISYVLVRVSLQFRRRCKKTTHTFWRIVSLQIVIFYFWSKIGWVRTKWFLVQGSR